MSVETNELGDRPLGELLQLHSKIGRELIRRDVSRTGNNPCADFAEFLVERTFGWTLNRNSRAGHDAVIDEKIRIEIKARRLGRPNASRQASAIRKIDSRPFDRLLGIVFSHDYNVILGVDVPFEVVRARSTHVPHTNSAKFFLRDDLLDEDGVIDCTARLQKVSAALLARAE